MRKMPPPTMELMTAAVRASVPIARISAASPLQHGCRLVRVFVGHPRSAHP
jgi:hypothetical protein